MTIDEIIKGIITRLDYLNVLFLAAGGLSFIILNKKINKEADAEIKGIKFKVKHFWLIAIIFTFLHFHFGNLLSDGCVKVKTVKSFIIADKDSLWEKITFSEAPLVFQGMRKKQSKYFDVHDFSNRLLAGILVSIIFALTFRNGIKNEKLMLLNFSGAILFFLVNWLIASHWRQALFSLTE